MVVKYLIIGAGPSGLSFAHALRMLGEESFVVIEKESSAGGLCRSDNVDGSPIDIGGGHFLDIKRQDVLRFLFSFLRADEWNEFNRISKIKFRNDLVDYPLESNLWQFPIPDQVDFLVSISQAESAVGGTPPDFFEEWISWKFGDKIAREYMLPYNRKIWSMDLNLLGTYWLYKLPNVSFRETLQSCLERKALGSMPAHARFLYPKKYGYGEVWKRMGEALKDKLLLNTPLFKIDLGERLVNGTISADRIITTVPWTQWSSFADLPASIKVRISELQYASIDVDYFPDNHETSAHWIYFPDNDIPYHRILCRNLFCEGSKGYWTETNTKRSQSTTNWRFTNEFAYPLNTLKKVEAVKEILGWAESYGIYGLGRWGTWEHMNSDVAVEKGIALAEKMVAGV